MRESQVAQAAAQSEQQAAAAREAAAEAREAIAAIQPPPPPLPPGEGETFVIEEGGRIVKVGPEGVQVTTSETAQPGFEFAPMIPQEAVTISIAFFIMLAVIIVGLPLARAFARRMDRATVVPKTGTGDPERLVRIEQAVEAMAVEVERISENQRFVTRLLTEGRTPDAALLARAAERTPEPEPDRR